MNFAKTYTIEHNLKVKAFGMVHPHSLDALGAHFRHVWKKVMEPRDSSYSDPSRPLPTDAAISEHTSGASRLRALAILINNGFTEQQAQSVLSNSIHGNGDEQDKNGVAASTAGTTAVDSGYSSQGQKSDQRQLAQASRESDGSLSTRAS